MTVGFTYRIERSRKDTTFKKMYDNHMDFLRIKNPANGGAFYDFTAEIAGGVKHFIKLFKGNGEFISLLEIATVSAHIVETSVSIPMITPNYGAGDIYEVYRRESNNSLTLLGSGTVAEYRPMYENNYSVVFTLLAASGIPKEAFIVKITNLLKKSANGVISTQAEPPVYERVIYSSEMSKIPASYSFNFDANKVGIQTYRHYQYTRDFPTKEAADATESSLLAQLMVLVATLAKTDYTKKILSATPGSGVIQIGQQIQFEALGNKGDYKITVVQNNSGATLSLSGVYVAGPVAGVDIVRITDITGEFTQITLTVQDTYGSTFEGAFSWG